MRRFEDVLSMAYFILIGIVGLIAAIMCIMAASDANAQEYRLLEPTQVSIEAYKYQDLHDPYTAPYDGTISQGAAFTTNLNIVRYHSLGLYWNNNLHFDQVQDGQVRRAGWAYEFGANIFPWYGHNKVQLFKQHESDHILDVASPTGLHFPVMDRYGIRINLLP
jgi:hypothetical protein